MEPERKTLFIYGLMDPVAAYRMFDKQERTKYCYIKEVIWLARKSNTPGMMTVDYTIFKDNSWINRSMRIGLTEEGWKLSPTEDMKIKPITSETVSEIDDQFYELINQRVSALFQRKVAFQTDFYVYPERMQNDAFLLSAPTEIYLSNDLEQSISCDLTGKRFEKPVILQKTSPVKYKGKQYTLYEGRSYEKSILKGLNVPIYLYWENSALKEAVKKINALPLDAYGLTEEHLKDLEFPEKPDLKTNTNLDNFNRGWQRFKINLEKKRQSAIDRWKNKVNIEEVLLSELKKKGEELPHGDLKRPKLG